MTTAIDQRNELDFLDWEAPQDQIELASLPYIQWLHGKGNAFAKLNKTLATGGWELPADVWGAMLSDHYEVVEVPHSKNTTVSAYLFAVLNIAVINTRFSWYRYSDGKTIYLDAYEPGATGRLNVFAIVKELGSQPVMLTLKGMAGKAFGAIKKQHLNTVIKAARTIGSSKAGYPQYLFWCPVGPGLSMMVGHGNEQSAITPPAPAWDAAALNDRKTMAKILTALYIGNDLRDLIADDLYAQSVAWKERLNKPLESSQAAGPAIDPNEADHLVGEQSQLFSDDEMPNFGGSGAYK